MTKMGCADSFQLITVIESGSSESRVGTRATYTTASSRPGQRLQASCRPLLLLLLRLITVASSLFTLLCIISIRAAFSLEPDSDRTNIPHFPTRIVTVTFLVLLSSMNDSEVSIMNSLISSTPLWPLCNLLYDVLQLPS